MSPIRLLVLAPLAVFIALAVLAAGVDGRLVGDGLVMDVLNWLAPVSSDDVHIDPVLDVTTLVVSALVGVLVMMRLVARDFRGAAFVVVAITVPVLLSRVVKELVERPAIEGPRDSYTFPSGSATWCVATVVALVLLARSERERRMIGFAGVALDADLQRHHRVGGMAPPVRRARGVVPRHCGRQRGVDRVRPPDGAADRSLAVLVGARVRRAALRARLAVVVAARSPLGERVAEGGTAGQEVEIAARGGDEQRIGHSVAA